jgi:protein translocase SecG subunit
MSLLIVFFTFVLVMNCLFLMLLILIQLPKKEAGAGIAFGGAATDALFGAGSGNALTKLTKYSASFFVALSVFLSVLHMHAAKQGSRRLEQELSRQASAATPMVPPLSRSNPTGQTAPTVSNAAAQTVTATSVANLLTTTITNQATATTGAAAQAEVPTTPPVATPANPPASPAK